MEHRELDRLDRHRVLFNRQLRDGRWEDTRGSFRRLWAHLPDEADVFLLCGDLTDYGLPDEARKNAAVLGANYPGSYWYKQSLKLLGAEQRHTQPRTASRTAGCSSRR